MTLVRNREIVIAGLQAVSMQFGADSVGKARVESALSLLRAAEWQPIETAPKDVPIIVNCRSGRPKIVHWSIDKRYEDGGVWALCDHGIQVAYRPTHWMPLPDPPEAK